MELSQMIYYAVTGEKNEYAIAAMGIIALAALGAYAYSLSQNPDCGPSAPCFFGALAKCSSASMRFEETVPLEGKFSYAYAIRGENRIPGMPCTIAYSLNITPENGEAGTRGGKASFARPGIEKAGVCKLANYANTTLQFDWVGTSEAAEIEGACLKLERTLKSG